MGLAAGARVGPYEILSALGAGGMGEVYRARDTRLKREVALKVLPASFASDPERLARFQREAEMLASLNHPNIAAIHGLEDGALVLELVEGETLADRIARGPIPVDEALPIARQIAEALEAAHEHGVIHRDLKPANIKVTPDGVVKVLDFGLAKLAEPTSVASGFSRKIDVTASPTITSPAMMTGVGMILGTAAYMAPEQARGKLVDKRSDIWAFGCVLFEMLTGTRAFAGEDVTDTLAAIVRGEPEWRALPAATPAAIRRLLRRCLQKDRLHRLADIADARIEIDEAQAGPAGAAGESALPPATPHWRQILPWAVAVVLSAATGIVAWNLRPAVETRPLTQFSHLLPAGQLFRNSGRPVVTLSPDGRRVAYNITAGVFVRAMGELEGRLIPSTERSLSGPMFSPDGESIVYFQDNELKRIGVTGGTAVVLCAATNPFGMSWEPDNTILFGQANGIMRVSADGGTPQLVVEALNGEAVHGPQLLPDGETVLFSATTAIGSTRWDQASIVAQSLRTGERTVLVRGGSDARWMPTGHLVYAVGDALFAIRFDPAALRVDGGAVPVGKGVLRAVSPGTQTATANFGVSRDGTLVYATSDIAEVQSRLVWVDRNGAVSALADRDGIYRTPRIAPNGASVAVSMRNPDGNSDIWVVDVARGTHTRLTSDASAETFPLWTPDGTRLVFSSDRKGANALHWMAADGTGSAEPLTEATANQAATSWLPDGSALTFYDVGGGYDIFTVKPGERPVRALDTPFREQGPVFSPDGRWLAYSSDDTGQAEIYFTPYPAIGSKVLVSSGGGRSPRWSSNGRELFYREGARMMVVAVDGGATMRIGAPRLLFEGPYAQELQDTGAHNYDVSGDGKRFLMIAPVSQQTSDEERPRIVVGQNWFEELKRLVPVN